ncbi:hypothetical protein C8A01DRAFT_18651 [Parachaetomium inaequale]|uniref:Uncharacterized protein n=1 Tax=Parachaetomium inaequale TaxID=2588326 RepID=A0AAN6PD42_9PEZI|nr:hypothetical protein C8A01DRAFT_18651 [Parachaetomium inaequale]
MGQPSQAGAAQLSSQHERLLVELLPVKDASQFHEWLNGEYVRGSWDEFLRDFLLANPGGPDPDKASTAQKARDALNSRGAMCMMHNPFKQSWSAEDHHVRFIAAVVSDNMVGGLRFEKDWKKSSLAIAGAVFEVLVYLKATAVPGAPDANPPRYEA